MSCNKTSNIPLQKSAIVPCDNLSDIMKSNNSLDKKNQQKYIVYKRRWLVLIMFVLYSTSNAFQWIQYAIINDVVVAFYSVTASAVNWTSMIYMALYIPFIFPATWMLDRFGLRFSILIGSFGTMLGAWIKVLSVQPDLYYVTFIGQTVCALSQVFILGVPPKLAAVWFGGDQVSSACSIGVFGNQLGCALGFLIPPHVVKYSEDLAVIAGGFSNLFYCQAIVTTGLFICIILGFSEKPETPPSAAQAAITSNKSTSSDTNSTFVYLQSIHALVANFQYIKLLVSYGINVGVFYAISTLLNQVVLYYFPNRNEDVGNIGLTIIVAGMIGSLLSGIILDKNHKYKETTLCVYTMSVAGLLLYTFTLSCGYIGIVYLSAAALGFFMTGYLPLGFEFAAEITYPQSEGTSAGLLNAAAQLFGILFTILNEYLIASFSDRIANLFLAVMLCIGSLLTLWIRADYKRQKALRTDK